MITLVENALVKATMTSLPTYSPSLDKSDTIGGRKRGSWSHLRAICWMLLGHRFVLGCFVSN